MSLDRLTALGLSGAGALREALRGQQAAFTRPLPSRTPLAEAEGRAAARLTEAS